MLPAIEQTRLHLSKNTRADRKARLGQFFTPQATAEFMAGLFPTGTGDCRLLDAGAGIGSLTAAFVERWLRGQSGFSRVDVEAFEVDPTLIPHLKREP